MYKPASNLSRSIAPQSSRAAGFTLIEILVALTIFTIVVTISVGSLMELLSANSKVQSIQQAVSNVSFALDDMARNIRTGSNYQCPATDFSNNNAAPADCTSGTSFAYTEADTSLTGTTLGSNRIAYKLQNGQIEQHLGSGTISDSNWQPLTTSNVTINALRFVVTGSYSTTGSPSDQRSPTVTIYIKGTVSTGSASTTASTFTLETTVTQQSVNL